MKNILIIPPLPSHNYIKMRTKEMALHLARNHNVYYVDWYLPPTNPILYKILANIYNLIKIIKIKKDNDLNIIDMRILHRPLKYAPKFNQYQLEKLLKKYKFDVIINASFFHFPFPRVKNEKWIYDLVDLYIVDNPTKFQKYVEKHIDDEIKNADVITACSKGLVDFVKERYKKQAILIPNGTDINIFNNVDFAYIENIRRKYNLENKYIYGCIGNMNIWYNLKPLLYAFRKVKLKFDDIAIMMIGPVVDKKIIEEFKNDKDIIFTGPIKSMDITNYFNLINVGLLPKIKEKPLNYAFHIKIIEYTAAKKNIISVSLDEVKRLNFPNILFADTEEQWEKQLINVRKVNWQSGWNDIVKPYDWGIITKQLELLF